MYAKVIRILSKDYLPISFLPPFKLETILNEVKVALLKTNKDYDLVLTCLHLSMTTWYLYSPIPKQAVSY